jgi:hypothetical protein
MSAKSLVIAAVVTLKLSLSSYAAVAASATQANLAAAEQLGGGKAQSSFTLVRGGGGHGGFGGGGFGGHGFGGGFGGRGFGGRGFGGRGFGRGWYGGYGWYGCYYPYYCY